MQEQHLRARKLAYWLIAAFCIGSALLVSVYVSDHSGEDHSDR